MVYQALLLNGHKEDFCRENGVRHQVHKLDGVCDKRKPSPHRDDAKARASAVSAVSCFCLHCLLIFSRFGSWTHTVAEVDVNLAFPGGIDLSTFKSVYKDVSEWDIYNHTGNAKPLNKIDLTNGNVKHFHGYFRL